MQLQVCRPTNRGSQTSLVADNLLCPELREKLEQPFRDVKKWQWCLEILLQQLLIVGQWFDVLILMCWLDGSS